MSRSGILVLGMHRSGTSALTGALKSCGAYVGLESELIGSNIENPNGFYERRDLRRLCDKLLLKLGCDWWKLSNFDLNKLNETDIYYARNELMIILQKLDNTHPFVLKEPRLTILLPIFIDLFRDFHIVFIYRNPIEVARSLQKRNAISMQHGLHLWEYYNFLCMRELNGKKYSIISYQDLVERPFVALNKLIKKINTENLDGNNLTLEGHKTIETSLKRSKASILDEILLTQFQQALWSCLKRKRCSHLFQTAELSPTTLAVLKDLEYQYSRFNNVSLPSFFSKGEDSGPYLKIYSKKIRFLALYADRILNKINVFLYFSADRFRCFVRKFYVNK